MSIILKTIDTEVKYTITPVALKALIANDLGVSSLEIEVKPIIHNVASEGPYDPREPGVPTVTKYEVTVKKQKPLPPGGRD